MAGLTPFYRGDTYQLEVDLSAYMVSIAGHVLTLTLKAGLADEDVDAALQYEHTVPAGAEAEAGLATIIVPSTSTNIVPGAYHYDLEWNQGGSPPVIKTIIASGEQPDGSDLDKLKVLADFTWAP